MKLPTPKKLPSGRWYMQVLIDGKRHSQSFDTQDEAYYWAVSLKTRAAEAVKPAKHLSVSEAVDRYIESKDSILSPSTIAGYRKIQRNLMGDIRSVPISTLTQDQVQRWVNKLAKTRTPKTVANAHGLLSAVLGAYHPSMTLRTTLPRKVKNEVAIPTENEIKAILEAARGSKYELPILLAVWLGLRQSEILALKKSSLRGDMLHIDHARVMGEEGMVLKDTKSYAGTRIIRVPPHLCELIQQQPEGEYLVPLTTHAVYNGFRRICDKAGVPHFSFHALRHFNASVMLAAGVPDKYGMKRIGHATNSMLKNVYQHTIKEKELQYDQLIDSYMESMLPSP